LIVNTWVTIINYNYLLVLPPYDETIAKVLN
jgi:hypothetical protein